MADSAQPAAGITPYPGFTRLAVGTLSSNPAVGWLELARPDKFNAFDAKMWEEFPRAVRQLDQDVQVRVVVVSGQGKHFCAGIDVGYLRDNFLTLQRVGGSDPGRQREALLHSILALQDAYSCLEQCRVPVVAAVHGRCIGGGIDLITACDLRICSQDATFCVKEVDVAIVADLGTLQRLPHIVGHGAAMDLALTADTVTAARALSLGLVTRVSGGSGREAVLRDAVELAEGLAAKPALALRGTKRVLLHAREHSVADGLQHVAVWNSAMLLSDDLMAAVAGGKPKGPGRPAGQHGSGGDGEGGAGRGAGAAGPRSKL